jgi:hypothetical protein
MQQKGRKVVLGEDNTQQDRRVTKGLLQAWPDLVDN